MSQPLNTGPSVSRYIDDQDHSQYIELVHHDPATVHVPPVGTDVVIGDAPHAIKGKVIRTVHRFSSSGWTIEVYLDIPKKRRW